MNAFAQFCEKHGIDPDNLDASDAVAIAKALSSSEGDGENDAEDEDAAIQKAVDAVEGEKPKGRMAGLLKSLDHATSGLRALVGIGKAVDEADLDGVPIEDEEEDEDLDLDYYDEDEYPEDPAGIEDEAEMDIDAALDATGVPDEEDDEPLRRSVSSLEKSLQNAGFDGMFDGNELLNTIMATYDERDEKRMGRVVKSVEALSKSFAKGLQAMDERLAALEDANQRMGMMPAGARPAAKYGMVQKSTDAADTHNIGGVNIPADKAEAVSKVRKALKDGVGEITARDVRAVELGYDHGNPVPVAQVLSRIPDED